MDRLTVFFTGIFLMLQITGLAGSTSRQYHFIDAPMSWTDASQYCRTKHTDLASVDDKNEHHSLVTAIGATDENFVWIGLEKAPAEWWIWSDGIGEVLLHEWDIEKHLGDCTIMAPNIDWFANHCDKEMAFLCYGYDSQGDIEYFLQTVGRTWQRAQSYCRQHHVDLVSASTKQQNENIQAAGEGSIIWIGLFRDYWVWSDGRHTSFRNWVENYPENVNDHNCTMISVADQYKWKDGACEAPHPFVCHGALKSKITVVKVKMTSAVNLNLPSVSDSMLQQIQARLEEQGVTDIKIKWRAAEGEQIFDCQNEDG
ncbi:macrophage mannose receptor 1-like [Brachionichthys hirsutus]|uniref:macrophage mannose receptor 1-like n=1 Tax=Brachionichthys hirsutus TaxID=412623 RepID=UPI0036050575